MVALRVAAKEWVAHLHDVPVGLKDEAFRRLDNRLMKAASKIADMPKKRSYSRDFTPQTERRVQFLIDRIPPTLWLKVRAKAKREGVSLRALILGWLKEWADA